MGGRILLYTAAAGVEKKLLVAFRAGQVAGLDTENFQTVVQCCLANALDGLLVQQRIAHDAALSHFFFLQLELRLHENQEVRAWSCDGYDRRENLADGNKRNVHGDK